MYHLRNLYNAQARYDTRIIRNKPRNYLAELCTTWIAQLVERLYVKRETRVRLQVPVFTFLLN